MEQKQNNKQIIFAQKLKQLRCANHLTQIELSKKIGISKQAISKLETGKAEPTLYTAVKIANFFNCSLDSLTFGPLYVENSTYLKLNDFIKEISDIETDYLKLAEQIKDLKDFVNDIKSIGLSSEKK